ncbi:Iron-sulfur cluster assembly protein 1 [Porphyridium purpureum]|uniref:Iron-sulfur cluster assembly protein n=1 Tax=Porphyridium purpureum TaxID=35688 RepID=A0A5J4YQD7_PORPP|nr:Iron-sulfur cluster assembly protein 1 [Porphyridium purpureum]|eukprot:POR5203..scf296_7
MAVRDAAGCGGVAGREGLWARRCAQAAAGGARTYHKNVLDHYENPRNVGSLDRNSPDVGTGLVGAPACGDVMKLQIRVDENGNIVESKFKTFGCGSAIASSSLATEMIRGMPMEEAARIKNKDIAAELKLPPVKLHCSMLAEDAIKAAVKDVLKKRELHKASQTMEASAETEAVSAVSSSSSASAMRQVLKLCRQKQRGVPTRAHAISPRAHAHPGVAFINVHLGAVYMTASLRTPEREA